MNDPRVELIQALENSIRLLQQEIASDTQRWTPRGSGNILIVTMPDGRPIRCGSQAKTFGLVIEKLGVEKVKPLNLKFGTHDLISNDQVYDTDYPSGEYYIYTNMTIWRKKEFLERIRDELGKPLQVEVFRRVTRQDDC